MLACAHPQLRPGAGASREPDVHDVPTLSLWDALRALRPKLWAEDLNRLVTFAQARKALALAARACPRTSQSKARARAARRRRPRGAPRRCWTSEAQLIRPSRTPAGSGPAALAQSRPCWRSPRR